jgi:hypothetical protein
MGAPPGNRDPFGIGCPVFVWLRIDQARKSFSADRLDLLARAASYEYRHDVFLGNDRHPISCGDAPNIDRAAEIGIYRAGFAVSRCLRAAERRAGKYAADATASSEASRQRCAPEPG